MGTWENQVISQAGGKEQKGKLKPNWDRRPAASGRRAVREKRCLEEGMPLPVFATVPRRSVSSNVVN